MTKAINLTFDNHALIANDGQSVAAALSAAGITVFRHTLNDSPRGMFCGMGVCQDCLVTVDGIPNRRACMTRVTEGLIVETQLARPRFGATQEEATTGNRTQRTPDVLVVGAGAGGLSAAIAARRSGASVLVLDERKIGGGQYYKQPASGAAIDAQQAEGATLIAEAKACGAEIMEGVEVWAASEGPLVVAEREGATLVVRPKAIVVATGAYERPIMAPGWTLPGVMTTGAAQTLWRSYGTLPGSKMVFCGSGPLNLQVALELSRGGADVVLLAERAASPLLHPATAMALFAVDFALAAKGVKMVASLLRRNVSVRHRTMLQRIEPHNDGLRAVFIDRHGRETVVEADVVCMNDGFEPQNELLRLLGGRFSYDPAVGHLRCLRSERMETSVPGLFAVGDCAGLGGAPAARAEGSIAGRAAAACVKVGCQEASERAIAEASRALSRHRRFQSLLWRLYDALPRKTEGVSDETILCRCEEITFGEVRGSLSGKPGHAGEIKRATRLGMGTCQGRYCGPVAARLAAAAASKPVDESSFFAPRPPIKPVSIEAVRNAQEMFEQDA